MSKKPVIVFVSAVYPSQYSLLCKYLRENDMADSWFMTTPGHASRHKSSFDHLISFQPDGNIVGPQSYYTSGKVERSARIARGMLKALKKFEQEKNTKIDLLVTHSLFGSPNWLYEELDAAIVSYIEFPSYRMHGNDPKYPPDPSQRMADHNMEMLHFHQVLRSDLTITPSAFSRSLFPIELQHRIFVQFEGFDISSNSFINHCKSQKNEKSIFTIAFSARDLSSAKGFETYVRLVDNLVRTGKSKDTRFLAIGSADASTYGYEQQWVERQYNGNIKTFKEHLLLKYPAAASVIEFPGKLPYEEYSKMLSTVDLFLYPLRYGVANWGLMEILARGGCVIGSNWGFVPELIIDNVNGLLLPDDDNAWLAAIDELRNDPERRLRFSQGAMVTGQSYHISRVAPRYMSLFKKAILQRQLR